MMWRWPSLWWIVAEIQVRRRRYPVLLLVRIAAIVLLGLVLLAAWPSGSQAGYRKWTYVQPGPEYGGQGDILALPDGTVLVSDFYSPSYRSTDGGRTWQEMKGLPRHWLRLRGVTNVVFAFFVGERVIWRSADQGETWQTLETPLGADWRVVDLATGGALWLLAEHWDTRQARLYRSDDGGSTWDGPRDLPQDPQGVASLRLSGTYLWTGFQTRGIYRSGDSGRTWTEANSGVPFRIDTGQRRYAVLRDMVETGENTLLAAVESHGPAGTLRSTDGGLTWAPALEGLDEGAKGDALQLLQSPQYSQDNTIYVVATGMASGINPTTRWIYSTTDGGRRWTALPGSNFDIADFKMAILPTSPQVLLVTRGGGPFARVGSYTLADPPAMELSSSSLDLLVGKGDSRPITATLTVNNQSTVPYTYTVASNMPWLRAEPSQGWAPSQVFITVDPTGMDEGIQSGQLTFASGPDTEKSPQEVPVRLRVVSSLFRLFLPLVKVSFWGAW